MNIIISNANNQPIYEQIYTQIKASIISGMLAEGEILPSIRHLAKELRISVITTKRAYDDLDRDGYIYSVPGKGSYVAKQNIDMLREAYLKDIEAHMYSILQIAAACNLELQQILEMFQLIAEEV